MKKKQEREQELVEPEDVDISRREKLERSVDKFIDMNRYEDDDDDALETLNFQDYSDDETAGYEKYPVLSGGVYMKYTDYEDTEEHLEKNKTLLKVRVISWARCCRGIFQMTFLRTPP